MRTNEINVQVMLPEASGTAIQSWKGSPPPAFSDFELIDESYNSLTYEKRWMAWYNKITWMMTLNLFGRLGESIWKVTARFDEEGSQTKLTLVGMLDESTRAALAQWL